MTYVEDCWFCGGSGWFDAENMECIVCQGFGIIQYEAEDEVEAE